MNRTTQAVAIVYGVAAVFSVSVGGQCIGTGLWWHAAAAYAIAAVLLSGIVREIHRATLPGEYTADYPPDERPAEVAAQASPPRRRRMGRLRAARTARREALTHNCCDRFWTSMGTTHDRGCPRSQRSAV